MEDFEKNIAILRKNFYKEEYQKWGSKQLS
jgi:hypothetical protein